MAFKVDEIRRYEGKTMIKGTNNGEIFEFVIDMANPTIREIEDEVNRRLTASTLMKLSKRGGSRKTKHSKKKRHSKKRHSKRRRHSSRRH